MKTPRINDEVHREIHHMHKVRHMNGMQISRELGIAVSTIYNHLSRFYPRDEQVVVTSSGRPKKVWENKLARNDGAFIMGEL